VNLIGNVVVSAGLGYFVDKRSGAGYDYPATLTVIMRRPGAPEEPDTAGSAGNALY
jgi:F0F1-type ATP synthase assembly protein I